MVGLLESVLTAAVVDDLTGTPSNKSRECTGLGLANVSASLFGGIAGCGMIGQAVGNVKYGGRGRLSTLFAGVFLLILMVALKPWVSRVPVIALVAIMVMVSVSTFDWKSLGNLVRHPRLSSSVMLVTVVITIATHNLAAGVVAGVLLSGVFFTFKVAHMLQVRGSGRGRRSLYLDGERPGVFASADALIEAFDVRRSRQAGPHRSSGAHFWDITAVGALDKVMERLRQHGCRVELTGLDASQSAADRTHQGLGLAAVALISGWSATGAWHWPRPCGESAPGFWPPPCRPPRAASGPWSRGCASRPDTAAAAP
jgi:SulP family sulfate permease